MAGADPLARVTVFCSKFLAGLSEPPQEGLTEAEKVRHGATEWEWDRGSGVLGGTRFHLVKPKSKKKPYPKVFRFQDPEYQSKVIAPGLAEAMQEPFESDAHFTCYTVQGATWWPRLTKPALPHLEALGLRVEFRVLALDFDNLGHASWTPELLQEHEAKLSAAQASGLAELGQGSVYYRTAHGWRLIFTLSRPVSPTEYESLVLELIDRFGQFGILTDDGCKDWTRLMRAPKVTRDGKQTWKDPFFTLDFNEDAPLLDPDLYTLSRVKEPKKASTPRRNGVARCELCPHPKEIEEIRRSPEFELAARACVGIGGFRRCFEGGPPPQEARHNTLRDDAAAITRSIGGFRWASARMVYAILGGYLFRIQGEDFTADAWISAESAMRKFSGDSPFFETEAPFDPPGVADTPEELVSRLKLPTRRAGGSCQWVTPPGVGKTSTLLDLAARELGSTWEMVFLCEPTREVAQEKLGILQKRHPEIPAFYIEGPQTEPTAPGFCQDYESAMRRNEKGRGWCGGCPLAGCSYRAQFSPVTQGQAGVYVTTLDAFPNVFRQLPAELQGKALLVADDARDLYQGTVREILLDRKALREELAAGEWWFERPKAAPAYRKKVGANGNVVGTYGVQDDLALWENLYRPFLKALLSDDPGAALRKLGGKLRGRKTMPEPFALSEGGEIPVPSWLAYDAELKIPSHLKALQAVYGSFAGGWGVSVQDAGSPRLRLQVASPEVCRAFLTGRGVRIGVVPLPAPFAAVLKLGRVQGGVLRNHRLELRQLGEMTWLPRGGGDRAKESQGWDGLLRALMQIFVRVYGPEGDAGLLVHLADKAALEKAGVDLSSVQVGTYGADHAATDTLSGCRNLLVRPFRLSPTDAEQQAQVLREIFLIPRKDATSREIPFWGTTRGFREPPHWREGLSDLGQAALDFFNLGAALNGLGRTRDWWASGTTTVWLLSELPVPGTWPTEFFSAREELVRLVALYLSRQAGPGPTKRTVRAALGELGAGIRDTTIEHALRVLQNEASKRAGVGPLLNGKPSYSLEGRDPLPRVTRISPSLPFSLAEVSWDAVRKELKPSTAADRDRLRRAFQALQTGAPLSDDPRGRESSIAAREQVARAAEVIAGRRRAEVAEFWAEQFASPAAATAGQEWLAQVEKMVASA